MPTDVEGRDTGFLHEGKDQGARDGRARRAGRARRTDPDDAVEAIHAAFAHFASNRPRPVHVQIPIDVLRNLKGPGPLSRDGAAASNGAARRTSRVRPL